MSAKLIKSNSIANISINRYKDFDILNKSNQDGNQNNNPDQNTFRKLKLNVQNSTNENNTSMNNTANNVNDNDYKVDLSKDKKLQNLKSQITFGGYREPAVYRYKNLDRMNISINDKEIPEQTTNSTRISDSGKRTS